MLGNPLIQASYILLTVITFAGAFFLPWDKYIYSMVLFGIFEGQGRVIMGYNPIFRVLFDILLLIGMLKVFIKHKRFINKKYIPNIIYYIITIHFFWWLLELFNPLGAGPFASFATAKYYIFPIFLYYAHLLEPLDINSKAFQTFCIVLMLSLTAQCILCIIQLSHGTEFMSGMSSYYTSLFDKYKYFEGFAFRPWGTSYNPGGASQFLFLCLPLVLLINPSQFTNKKSKVTFNLFFYLFIALNWFTLFISQVRSAWIKHILIMLTFALLTFGFSKFKIKLISKFVLSIAILGSIGFFAAQRFTDLEKTMDLASSIDRIENLRSKGVSNQREGLKEVIHQLNIRLKLPLGFGVGMCTSFLPHFPARRKQIVEIPDWHYWAMDNAYVFALLELGLGAFFYLGVFFSIILLITIRGLILLRRRHFEKVRIVIPIISIFFVLLVGNWGAISIPFNPESFYFWLYAGIASATVFNRSSEEETQNDDTSNGDHSLDKNEEYVPIAVGQG